VSARSPPLVARSAPLVTRWGRYVKGERAATSDGFAVERPTIRHLS
jgi:hypothetical protein